MASLQDIITEDIEKKIPTNQIPKIRRTIEELIQNEKYANYLQVPKKINLFLNYFSVQYVQNKIQSSLSTYFLWLKIVDDEIDGNNPIGNKIKGELRKPRIKFNKESNSNCALLLTSLLKGHLKKSNYNSFVIGLNKLYNAVFQERDSSTMAQYIRNREKVGKLTAYCAYQIMKPYLKNNQQKFLEFFQQLGSLGCLVDSIVDIKKDVDDKVLRFEPLIKDRINLYFKTIQRGTIFILKHPGLYKSFLYSLINNIKDKYL